MKNPRLLASIALVAFSALATTLAWPDLPAQITTHWTAQGQPNGYGGRAILWLLGPGLMAANILLFALLPRLSPRQYSVATFAATLSHLMLVITALLAYLHAVLLAQALGWHIDIGRAALGGASVLILLVGNVMGKVKRNFFIGIRTPWTLADERVWFHTHRLAGKLMVGAGALGLLGTLAGMSAHAWLGLLLASVLLPAAYSLVLYKKLEKENP